MITKLKGNIENKHEENIDLDVNGVVFRILMSKKYFKTWSYRKLHGDFYS